MTMSQPEGAPPLRRASTVILLRDAPAFEVVMIRRHENMVFAGGALVFPGGRVDEADADASWAALADGLDTDPRLAAGQVAAAREAFEETGVLLARRAGEEELAGAAVAGALSPWRGETERDARNFRILMEREKLRLACDRLQLFAHWIAPPTITKRYDTLFFAARAPADQPLLQDGREATEAMWIEPQKALDAGRAGTRKIIFPTARNLELLALSKSVEELAAATRARPIRPVLTTVTEREGRRYVTIPDDLGYPVTEESLTDALRE